MSQYGAWGARSRASAPADPGLLLPGHDAGHRHRTIRVLVSADTDNDVRVVPASRAEGARVGTGATYALPATAGIKTWRLRTVGGDTVLDYDNGAWRTHRPGGQRSPATRSSSAPATLSLRVGGAPRLPRNAAAQQRATP